jgi:hypothetical protein
MRILQLACNVFTLEVDEGCAELIMGPRELQISTNEVLLASTPDRRRSFALLEKLVISMFVLLSLSDGSRSCRMGPGVGNGVWWWSGRGSLRRRAGCA